MLDELELLESVPLLNETFPSRWMLSSCPSPGFVKTCTPYPNWLNMMLSRAVTGPGQHHVQPVRVWRARLHESGRGAARQHPSRRERLVQQRHAVQQLELIQYPVRRRRLFHGRRAAEQHDV